MLKFSAFLFLLLPVLSFAQPKNNSSLTIENIMRDPKWIGTSPANPFWGAEGQTLYFDWNPEKASSDSLYYITLKNKNPQKASVNQKQNVLRHNSLTFNNSRTAYVYSENGDIFYKEIKSNKLHQITNTVENEFSPEFSFKSSKVVYNAGQDLFAWDISSGATTQLTNFQATSNARESKEPALSLQEKWLKTDQLLYMEILKERKENKDLAKTYTNNLPKKESLRKINTDGRRAQRISINSTGRYISYQLTKPATPGKATIIPDLQLIYPVGQKWGFYKAPMSFLYLTGKPIPYI